MSRAGSIPRGRGLLLLLALLAAVWTSPVTSGITDRDYTIIIRGHRFEPPEEPAGAQPAPEARDSAGAPSPRIVQFDGPLTREQTALLKERYGLRLDEYIPHYAYLERLDAARMEALRRLEFFRWSGPYESAFKLDPAIGKHTFVTEERRAEPGILLSVDAFAGTDLSELAARICALGFEVVSTTDEPEHGIQRLQIRVDSPSDAERIARFQDVKSIEEVGDVTLNRSPPPK